MVQIKSKNILEKGRGNQEITRKKRKIKRKRKWKGREGKKETSGRR